MGKAQHRAQQALQDAQKAKGKGKTAERPPAPSSTTPPPAMAAQAPAREDAPATPTDDELAGKQYVEVGGNGTGVRSRRIRVYVQGDPDTKGWKVVQPSDGVKDEDSDDGAWLKPPHPELLESSEGITYYRVPAEAMHAADAVYRFTRNGLAGTEQYLKKWDPSRHDSAAPKDAAKTTRGKGRKQTTRDGSATAILGPRPKDDPEALRLWRIAYRRMRAEKAGKTYHPRGEKPAPAQTSPETSPAETRGKTTGKTSRTPPPASRSTGATKTTPPKGKTPPTPPGAKAKTSTKATKGATPPARAATKPFPKAEQTKKKGTGKKGAARASRA